MLLEIKENTPTSVLIKEYDLDPSTQDVIGHALCLYTSSDWQEERAVDTIMRYQSFSSGTKLELLLTL